jgi:hypothetical protein
MIWVAIFSVAIFDLSNIPCEFHHIAGLVLCVSGLFLCGMFADTLIEEARKIKELEEEVKKDDKD